MQVRRLCRKPGEQVSQRQLADDLTLTSSGTTRLIDRMEEAGLVRRVPWPRTSPPRTAASAPSRCWPRAAASPTPDISRHCAWARRSCR